MLWEVSHISIKLFPEAQIILSGEGVAGLVPHPAGAAWPQSQYNPCQNINGIFHRTTTNESKICIETQRPLNSKTVLRKEEKN